MSEDKNSDEDPFGDLWRWENQCFEEVESQPNFELQLQQERDISHQKLWYLFQNAATCVAQLHKGSGGGSGGCPACAPGSRSSDHHTTRWVPFQTAAGSVTALYKESMDSVRRCTELGVLHGQQRRTRDLIGWLRRRRLIRREELLAFLCGKPLPTQAARNTHRASPRPHLCDRSSPRPPVPLRLVTSSVASQSQADSLQPFRDALALSSLQGAMSAVSVRPASPAAGAGAASVHGHRRRHSPGHRLTSGSPGPADPAHHHCHAVKRPATPASPTDVIMDSPTHKRPRYT